jgi:hypothetical protein
VSGIHHDDALRIDPVIAFIRSRVPGPRPGEITAATDLRTGLWMIWEDAETLMAAFFSTFHVASGDFQLVRYFPREGGLLTAFVASISGKRPVVPPRLTVGMLARAVRDGVWRSEVLERQPD